MIQRIQTIYYLIAIALLAWVSTGENIVSFKIDAQNYVETVEMNINSKGIDANATLSLTESELEEFEKHITATGATFNTEGSHGTWTNSIPVYILFLIIALLILITLVSFKNQKRQLRLGRIAFFLSILCLIGLFALIMIIPGNLAETAQSFMTDDEININRSLGLGFYLLCATIPFIFLGNIGVKRDLDLLKSLDRLR